MKTFIIAIAILLTFEVTKGYEEQRSGEAVWAAQKTIREAVQESLQGVHEPYELQRMNGRGKIRFTSIESSFATCKMYGESWGGIFTESYGARKLYYRCIKTTREAARKAAQEEALAAYEADREPNDYIMQMSSEGKVRFTSSRSHSFSSLESCRMSGQIWKEAHSRNSFSCIKKNDW